MTRIDRLILAVLDQAGVVAIPPKAIVLTLRDEHGRDAPSKSQINRRLRNELSERGLVHQPFAGEARGYYALTELGERYFHDPDAEPTEFIANIDDTAGSDEHPDE